MKLLGDTFISKFGQANIDKIFSKEALLQIGALFSVCCSTSMGRKVVRFKNEDGLRTSIKSYPVTFETVSYATKNELEDAICEFYGNGYAVNIMNPYLVLVISNSSNRSEEGTVAVDDFLTIS